VTLGSLAPLLAGEGQNAFQVYTPTPDKSAGRNMTEQGMEVSV